jgi:histidinol dehydrogenase
MRLFNCEIVREDGNAGKEDFTLTGDELEEYLKNPDFTVHKAQKITADKEKIREVMESKLQEAYTEILGYHNLQTGDITPLQQNKIEGEEDELVDSVTEWIERKLV